MPKEAHLAQGRVLMMRLGGRPSAGEQDPEGSFTCSISGRPAIAQYDGTPVIAVVRARLRDDLLHDQYP